MLTITYLRDQTDQETSFIAGCGGTTSPVLTAKNSILVGESFLSCIVIAKSLKKQLSFVVVVVVVITDAVEVINALLL